MRRHRLVLALLASFAAMALTLGCSGDEGTEVTAGATTPEGTVDPLPPIEGTASEQLEAARARWDAAGIDSYEMTWSTSCFCPTRSGGSRVIGGEVVEVWSDGYSAGPPTTHPATTVPTSAGEDAPDVLPVEPDADPASPPPGERLETVEDFFAVIEHAIDGGAAAVEVDYEPDTGRPIGIDVDWASNAVDDEMGYSIDSFEVLGDDADPSDPHITPYTPTTGTSLAPAVREVAQAELDVNHGCGHGLFVGNRDQTIALRLAWRGDALPAIEPAFFEMGPYTLPDEDWEGEVLVGTDLYANWCDDVVVAGEPQPAVAETWPVTGGELAVTVHPGRGQCGPLVEGTVTDLEVRSPDGATVTIPDVDLLNDAWGCMAG